MKSYQIELSDQLASVIEYQAELLGGTPEELIRSSLWEHFRGSLQLIPPAGIESFLDTMAARLEKISAKANAAAGQLNCIQCTQKLTPSDVDAGFCSKCEAPIGGAGAL